MTPSAVPISAVSGLPDPRRYGPGEPGNALLRHADLGEDEALRGALRELLARRADAEIKRLLRLADSREAYGCLWRALCAATEHPGGQDDAIRPQVFAMPLVVVSGARSSATVTGTLPDTAAVVGVLERHGALGPNRNVGFGNALVSLDTLEELSPGAVHDWSLQAAAEPRALAPEPVAVRPGEQVHLRFLLGAAIAPADAPAIAETAAHIGAWGFRLARVLGAQIAVPGVELLVLPRPPAGVLRAAYAGRSAQLETAFNLFMSTAIKRLRAAAGDPAVVISVHEAGGGGAEVRVSLSSLFDDTVLEGYRWPLHPLDDLDGIAGTVDQLAADCRLTDVRRVGAVLPEGGGDSPLFLRAGDALAASKH